MTGSVPIVLPWSRSDFITARRKCAGRLFEDTGHTLGRDIRAAAEREAIAGQERRGWNSAERVAIENVRAPIGVDANGYERVVDQLLNR